jgi:hypothetical protein
MHRHAVSFIDRLAVGAVRNQQSCVDMRYIVRSGDDGVISPAGNIKLPRGLEEFEELLDDSDLIGFGNNAKHEISVVEQIECP